LSRKNPAIDFLRHFNSRAELRVDLHTLIDRYAEQLLIDARAYTYPVDLQKVFQHYGLRSRGDSQLGRRGAITPDLDILYNSSDSEQVQLFTQAHELIEALILTIAGDNPEYDPPWLTDDQVQALLDRKEYFCDYGAAAIHMPMELFRPYVENYGFSMKIAKALANTSDLSLTAVARRMLDTELRKAAFIIWRYGHSPSEFVPSSVGQLPIWGSRTAMDPPKKLRVDRVFSSPSLSRHIYVHKSIENSTAIALAFRAPGGTTTIGYDYLEICKRPGCYLTENIPAAYDGQPRVMSFVYFDDQAEEQHLLCSQG